MGVHGVITMAVMVMMTMVVVVMMAMTVIVLLFHRQGFDPCAAVDRDQRLVLGTLSTGSKKLSIPSH